MNQSRMAELANQLVSSARRGKLVWKEGLQRNSYVVRMPEVSLTIVDKGDFWLALELTNQQGDVVDFLSSFDDRGAEPTLREIYNIARRSVLNADQNIDKALEYLRRV